MFVETGAFMFDILEEHFEELQALWNRRQLAVESADYDLQSLRKIDARIAAHTDGLVLAETDALPVLLAGLNSGEFLPILSAVHVLLTMGGSECTRLVVDALRVAEGPAIDALRWSLCHGPITAVEKTLKQLVTSASASIAVIAAEALACHRHLDPQSPCIEEFLTDELPDIRKAGLRIKAHLAAS